MLPLHSSAGKRDAETGQHLPLPQLPSQLPNKCSNPILMHSLQQVYALFSPIAPVPLLNHNRFPEAAASSFSVSFLLSFRRCSSCASAQIRSSDTRRSIEQRVEDFQVMADGKVPHLLMPFRRIGHSFICQTF
ncbi:uncharacterized protein LOC116247221 isoform X2 [Nymphaea colorata]|uniref:uncharacterized protein LOC116247221 isoform X2 n=1 Tax=Nymphaea colorata TaxID=210225 RepID=UPI00214ED24C|nr:uncharacterized protein LOC116247221 isoform X2 [Nymphaea colorata]